MEEEAVPEEGLVFNFSRGFKMAWYFSKMMLTEGYSSPVTILSSLRKTGGSLSTTR